MSTSQVMKHDDLRAELVESIAMHNELRVVPHPSLQVIYSQRAMARHDPLLRSGALTRRFLCSPKVSASYLSRSMLLGIALTLQAWRYFLKPTEQRRTPTRHPRYGLVCAHTPCPGA
jgi:hypothetical protein